MSLLATALCIVLEVNVHNHSNSTTIGDETRVVLNNMETVEYTQSVSYFEDREPIVKMGNLQTGVMYDIEAKKLSGDKYQLSIDYTVKILDEMKAFKYGGSELNYINLPDTRECSMNQVIDIKPSNEALEIGEGKCALSIKLRPMER